MPAASSTSSLRSIYLKMLRDWTEAEILSAAKDQTLHLGASKVWLLQ
jgi:hypothetical protein